MKITFFTPGKPATQGSKRAFWRPGMKHAGLKDDCERNLPWRTDVKDAARQVLKDMGSPDLSGYEGPVKMTITFFLLRPKSHFGSGKNSGNLKPAAPQHPTGKPDMTKLVRPVEDSLKGLVWRDDSQIVETVAKKVYCSEPVEEGCFVELTLERGM